MCGFDRAREGGGEPTKKQPKLGLFTTQKKSDVLILINFISIFHIAESIYMFNHESLLDDYIVFQKEPIHIMYINMYGCYIIKN